MPVNDIIKHAIDNNPLKMKDAFEDEMKGRVRNALNAKYQEMTSDAEPAVEEPIEEFPEAFEDVEESVEEETEEK